MEARGVNRLNRAGIVACGLVLILALGLQEFSFWRARRQAMAREGKKVMQFLDAGQYVAVVVDGKMKTYG